MTAPILARSLGVDARGDVAAAQSVAILAVAVMAIGLPETVTHFVARRAFRTPRQVWTFVAVSVVSGFLAWLLVRELSLWLGGGSESAARLIQFAALSIVPALLLGLVRGFAAGSGLWLHVAAERVIGSAVRLFGSIALFAIGSLGATEAVALIVFGPLAGGLAYLFPRSVHAKRLVREPVPIRSAGSYALRVWVGSLAGIVLMRIDQVLLIPLAGPTALGVYAVAVAISEVPLIVNSAIRDVTFTDQSAELDYARVVASARLSFLATGLIAGAFTLAAPYAIPTVFGDQFEGAVVVTALLLLAVTVGTPGSLAGAGLAAIGRPGMRSLSLAIAAVTAIAALVLLAPRWGAVGAAYATLIGNLVSSNVCIAIWCRLTKTPFLQFYAIRTTDVLSLFRTASRLFPILGKISQGLYRYNIFTDLRGGAEDVPYKIRRRLFTLTSPIASAVMSMRSRWATSPLIGEMDAPVVTLTSYGRRIGRVNRTIESIGRGTCKPSRIILWIDDPSWFSDLPPNVRRQQQRGLEVELTQNLGPHTKYFPYISSRGAEAKSFATADDDIVYPRWWLARLVEASRVSPGEIVCHRAHRIETERNSIRAYSKWTSVRTTCAHPSVFATGVSGVLYPPAMVVALRDAGLKFRSFCPSADDVWLHWVALTNRISVRQIANVPRGFWITPGTQENALMAINLAGANDAAIAALYGLRQIDQIAYGPVTADEEASK
nr:oligosaccharide flippase family protein [Mycolicibacterium neoaurum]